METVPGGTEVRFSLRNGEVQAFAEAAGSVTALRLVK